MKELQELHKAIEKVCRAFADKQGISYDNHDYVYVFFECGMIVLNLNNVIEDLEGNHRAGLILEWYQEAYERAINKKPFINYTSYAMGLRDY